MNRSFLLAFILVGVCAADFTMEVPLRGGMEYNVHLNRTHIAVRETVSGRLVFDFWMPQGCWGKRVAARSRGRFLLLDFPCSRKRNEEYWATKEQVLYA